MEQQQYLWAEHSDSLSFMLASLAVCQYEDTDGWVIVQYDENGDPHRLGKTVFQSKELAMRFAEANLTEEAHQLPLLERAPSIDPSLLLASYVLAFGIAAVFALATDHSIAMVAMTAGLTMITNAAALGEPIPLDQDEDVEQGDV